MSFQIDKAEELYKLGIRELNEYRNISKAIQYFEEALALNPYLEKAKFAIQEAKEGLKWKPAIFCEKCGKLQTPKSEYPSLDFESFCQNCGNPVNLNREKYIGIGELVTKLISFGTFLVFILIFLAMPNLQVTTEGIFLLWNSILDGVFLALTLTPVVILFLIVINDPWAFTFYKIKAFLEGPKGNMPLRLISGLLVLFAALYTYFFLLLTPFLAMHKKGIWRSIKHQKKVLKYTLIIFGLILTIRFLSGVFY